MVVIVFFMWYNKLMKNMLTKAQEVENSIFGALRSKIWTPFVHACKEFKMIEPGDKIAVCISGGKDSMILAVLMRMLQRISDFPFDLVFLAMNPGYSEKNKQKLRDNLALLEIDAEMFETNIFDVTVSAGGSPCYLCARMRRGHLYAKAKELGCNKIALGHHKSDVIETTLMSMLFSGQIQGMLPKLKSKNFDGMQLIRPLYYVLEDDILKWRDKNGLEFLACACKFTEENYAPEKETNSARKQTKQIIADLKTKIVDVEDHILKSVTNCQVDTMVAYKKNGETHSFLDEF